MTALRAIDGLIVEIPPIESAFNLVDRSMPRSRNGVRISTTAMAMAMATLVNSREFGKSQAINPAGLSSFQAYDLPKIKLFAFYLGLPITISCLLALGHTTGSGTVDWYILYYPFRGLLLWLSYCVGTQVFVAIFKPTARWFLPALFFGWAVGSPVANYLGRIIWQALFPLATTNYAHFFFGNSSMSNSSFYQLYGYFYVSLVLWIVGAVFFYRVVKAPLFGFANAERQEQSNLVIKVSKENSPLLSRIPRNLGNRILAITAEEHYLRVYTPLGNALIFHRLSDAVKELGADGLLVHRSHWVSIGAIVGTKKVRQTTFLLLSNGLEIPVSRSFRQKAIEVGIIPS